MITVYGLEARTYETFEKDNKRCLDFVYLHGALEDKNGFDLVGVTKETYNIICSNETCIMSVNVILCDGSKEEGVLFFWHDYRTGRQHGLIVDKDDIESKKYAQDCLNEKVACL